MDIKIEKKPAFTVVGMKYHGQGPSPKIPQLWGEFLQRVSEIGNRTNENLCYGAEDNYDEATNEFDYLACVEVDQADNVPAGMEQWQIPANTYAIFPTSLPDINETFASIDAKLADSGLERLPAPEFELYDETFDNQDPTSLLYIYVPVKEG